MPVSGYGVGLLCSVAVPAWPGLAEVQEEFPQYQIWQEVVRDRTRYVACSRRAGSRPHTLVTADLRELRGALAAGTCPGSAGSSGDAADTVAAGSVTGQAGRPAARPSAPGGQA